MFPKKIWKMDTKRLHENESDKEVWLNENIEYNRILIG